MLRRNQKGAAHYLLAFFVVLLLVVAAGYYVWRRQTSGSSSIEQQTASVASKNGESCGGEWFDTHTHLDDSELPRELSERMKENNVSCAVIFAQMNEDNFEEDLEMFEDDLGEARSVFIPFVDVVEGSNTKITRKYLEKVYKETDGRLKGFGEFALYRQELAGTDITKAPWTTIYDFAAQKDLFVMIHNGLEPGARAKLEKAMSDHPNTKFLIHGFEEGIDGYTQMLKKHKNMYFTLDTATFMKLGGLSTTTHYMYPQGEGSVNKFISEYNPNKHAVLDYAKQWRNLVISAPDRVMWGTDVSFDWHVDKKVYDQLIELSEDFAATLPIEVKNKYKYENAVRLFRDEAYYFKPTTGDKDDEEIHD